MSGIAQLVELLVAVLLVATIAYSFLLDRRLRELRADEQTMRRTVVDLAAATDNAERAITGLRTTLADCDGTIAERLESAGSVASGLSGSVKAGEEVIDRIRSIVVAARRIEASAHLHIGEAVPLFGEAVPLYEADTPLGRNPKLAATAAAAEALAMRARARIRSAA